MTDDPTAAPQPATPGEALRWAANRVDPGPLRRWAVELDASSATLGEVDLDAVEQRVDHHCRSDGDVPALIVEDVPALVAEVRRLRGEWQVLTDRWGHYKRQYLGALEEAERVRGKLAETEAARALADEVVLGNAVVTPELDAAPAADPGVYQLPPEPEGPLWYPDGTKLVRIPPPPGYTTHVWAPASSGTWYSGTTWGALLCAAAHPLSTTPPAGTEGERAPSACGALAPADDPDDHECDLGACHSGPHECAGCGATWRDAADAAAEPAGTEGESDG